MMSFLIAENLTSFKPRHFNNFVNLFSEIEHNSQLTNFQLIDR